MTAEVATRRPTPTADGRIAIGALLCLQAAYALLFLWRSSFVVDGDRWFALFDDAMISMTYARTFAEGGGLVWYPGAERVQGYTNFLWTIAMAVVHLLPLQERLLAGVFQAVSLLSVPLTSLYTWRAYRLLAPDSEHGWIPVLLVGTYFPLYAWAGLGMEAGFLTLLVSILTHEVLRTERDGRARPTAFVAMAAGLLTRLDFALFAVLAGSFLLLATRARRTELLRTFSGLAAAATVGALLCGWQYFYYGELLPNTFVLKLGVPLATRLERGLETTHAFLSSMSYVLLLTAALLFGRHARASVRARAWLLCAPAVALLYNVYTGGDAWEWGPNANRFELPIVPILLLAMGGAVDWLARAVELPRAQTTALALLLCALVTVRINAGTFEANAAGAKLREAALAEPIFTRAAHDEYVLRAGLFVREAATRPLVVAVTSAGIAPYVIREGRFIDLLGRSDRHVAALPPRDVPFLPGHVKWDLAWSIGRLDPDLSIGAPPGPLVAPVRYFGAEVVRIPGLVPIFVKRTVLEEAMVPLPRLVELYRTFLGGSEANLLGHVLRVRGFSLRAGQETFELKRGEGSFTVPAGATLAFTLRAEAPIAVTVREDGHPTRETLLEPDEPQRHVVVAVRAVEVQVEAAAADGQAPEPAPRLSMTSLSLR